MSVTLRFWIIIISRISDSFSRITYSKSQDSTFHKQIVKKGYENILISVLMIYTLELKKNNVVQLSGVIPAAAILTSYKKSKTLLGELFWD